MTVDRLSLAGRVALVTGASSGLGRHFAGVLSQAGATVVLAARRLDRLDEAVAQIRDRGQAAQAVALDVTDAASVKAAFDTLAERGLCADVLVNNAGVAVSRPLLAQTEADWDGVVDTNLKGAWLVAQEAARRLVAAGKPGSIVNVASITGERVAGGVAPYCASKAGLIQLTKAMALELARVGIRVNALAPGYVSTELNQDFLASGAGERLRARIPQQRFGRVEDLDGPLLLLASEAGAYVTGSVLAVDGGHLVSSL
ncbi:SDR family NAD(P)-dependent oxidoreductase [Leptothrix discophora]|uniref:SDR family oxidoreductase n=1 Tax=Leptothrix discophora TaxID=89 RepID=A0ABT9G4J9_LEPDI|nr:SDR family oxidoreductase [Leptothrix discophora]MDP4301417.1 SDR family oxidoreductase [Leptothrix discophora]